MVDIRKVYFLLIFIGTCFSFADSSTALSYCIPCSEEYKDQTCEYISYGAHTDLAPISIREGKTGVTCKPCSDVFPNQDLSIICSELVEQVELQQPISFPEYISVDTGCEYEDNEVYHEGQCQTLLGQSNCAEGHWLIRRNKVLTCEVRPCPIGKIEFNNTCSEPSFSLCRREDNQYFELYSDGTAECSCDYIYVKDPSTGECHVKHSQGPCKVGWMIDKLVDSSPVCIPDICHPYRMIKSYLTSNRRYPFIDADFALIYDGSVNRMKCAKKMYNGNCEHRRRRLDHIPTAECNYDIPDYETVPIVTEHRSLRLVTCRKNQKKGFDGTCNNIFTIETRP